MGFCDADNCILGFWDAVERAREKKNIKVFKLYFWPFPIYLHKCRLSAGRISVITSFFFFFFQLALCGRQKFKFKHVRTQMLHRRKQW